MKTEETAKTTGTMMKSVLSNVCRMLLCAAFFSLHASLLTSCSEEDGDDGEFADWQRRNEQFFASLADSMRAAPTQWVHYKSFSLDQSAEGSPDDYIYAKIVSSGTETESPKATDSVRVSYQGRLIASTSYPEGYVFDGTVYGDYDDKTNATKRQLAGANIDGYVTALLRMHRGDHWRVYIPSALAYGTKGNGTIPGHSVLIFDLTLFDFSPAGQAMPTWSARRGR